MRETKTLAQRTGKIVAFSLFIWNIFVFKVFLPTQKMAFEHLRITDLEEPLSTIVQLNISMKELGLSLNKEGTVFLQANLTNSMVNLRVQSNNDFSLEVHFQFEYFFTFCETASHSFL
jgi:hypothetical protein